MKTMTKLKVIAVMLAAVFLFQATSQNVLMALADEIREVVDTKEETVEVEEIPFNDLIDDSAFNEENIIGELEDKRTLNSKEYVMNNDTIVVEQFAEPIHYEEDGKYIEKDNTLIEKEENGEKYYENKSNSFKVKFKQKIKEGKDFVEISENGYVIRMEHKEEYEIEEKTKEEKEKKKDEKKTKKYKEKKGKVKYKNKSKDVSIEYEVLNNSLKENIILNSKREKYEFEFNIEVENLTLELIKDGKVLAKDYNGEERYYIPAPFMVDSNGETNYDVYYELESLSENEYSLKIIANEEWINEKAAFPVTIDPALNSIENQPSFLFRNVHEGSSQVTTSGDAAYVGKKNGTTISNVYFMFEVPSKPEYELLNVGFWFKHKTRMPGALINNITYTANLMKPTDFNSITYSNQPEIEETYLSCGAETNIASTEQDYTVGILANKIVSDQVIIGLIANEEMTNQAYAQIYTGAQNTPSVTLVYQLMSGIDERYSLENFSISGSTAYVNNATRKLSATIDVASVNTLSEKSLSATLAYTSNYDSLIDNFNLPRTFGKNLKLNYQQFMIDHSSEGYYSYIDGDGSITNFYQDYDQYYRALTKNLSLYVQETKVILFDEENNQLIFNNGKLTEIKNPTKYKTDVIKINYQGTQTNLTDKITSIEHYKEGLGTVTYSMVFSYNGSGYVSQITTKKAATTLSTTQFVYEEVQTGEEGRLLQILNATDEDATSEWYKFKLDYDSVQSSLLSGVYNNLGEGYYVTYERNQDEVDKVYYAQGDASGTNTNYRTYDNVEFRINSNNVTEITTRRNGATLSTKYVSFDSSRSVISEWTESATGKIEVHNPGRYEGGWVNGKYKSVSKSDISYEEKINTSITGSRTINNSSSISGTITNVPLKSGVYALNMKLKSTSSINVTVSIYNRKRTVILPYGGEIYFSLPYIYEQSLDFTIKNNSTSNYYPVTVSNVYFGRTSQSSVVSAYLTEDGSLPDIDTPRLSYAVAITDTGSYTRTDYDDNARVKETQTYNSADNTVKSTTYEYCSAYNDSSETPRDVSKATTKRGSETVNLTTYSYTNGKLSKKVDTYGDIKYQTTYSITETNSGKSETTTQDGITTTNTYGISGGDNRLLSTQSTNRREEYTYDSYGNVTSIKVYSVYSGSSTLEQIQNNTYVNGRLTKTEILDGSNQSVIYTDIGYDNTLLVNEISSNGQTALGMSYSTATGNDGTDDLTRITYGNGQVLNYTYSGNTTTLRYKSSANTSYVDARYTYITDANDRVIQAKHSNNNGDQLIYNYEQLDNESIRKFSATGTLTRTFYYQENYDVDKERITDYTIGVMMPGCVTDDFTTTYSYDYRNRVTQTELRGFTTNYTYDEANRLTSYQRTIGGVEKEAKVLAYDDTSSSASNRILSITSASETYNTFVTYGTDAIVSSMSYFDTTHSYTYDRIGRLTKETIDGQEYNYTYDSANQIINAAGANYTYDNVTKRLTSITSNNGTEYFRYDDLGNPVLYKGDGANQTANFTWKQGRELVSGSLNGKNFSYVYDSNGMRYSKTVNNKTTDYYLDGTTILGENRIGHGGVIMYIYDETGIAGMIYNSSYYTFEKNILGDVIAVVNSNNQEVARYVYDAWGNVISQSGSMADKNPFRYRGYYYDTETGFYYLQSRYYDPSIRRFINADDHSIIGKLSQSAGEVNLFAYCGNNPVMNIDPSGHAAPLAIVGTTALAILALTGLYLVGQTQSFSNAISNVANDLSGFTEDLAQMLRDYLAKLTPKENYNNTEKHHIVAKNAKKALPARIILLLSGIGINDKINIVELNNNYHRVIHTNVYYSIVNVTITASYLVGGKNGVVLLLYTYKLILGEL